MGMSGDFEVAIEEGATHVRVGSAIFGKRSYRMDGELGSAQSSPMTSTLEHATVIGNELALSFTDGFEAYLPLPMLRRSCPCAGCQGEPDALGRVLRPKVEYGPNAFELDGLKASVDMPSSFFGRTVIRRAYTATPTSRSSQECHRRRLRTSNEQLNVVFSAHNDLTSLPFFPQRK